jgi:hypothetical protein
VDSIDPCFRPTQLSLQPFEFVDVDGIDFKAGPRSRATLESSNYGCDATAINIADDDSIACGRASPHLEGLRIMGVRATTSPKTNPPAMH